MKTGGIKQIEQSNLNEKFPCQTIMCSMFYKALKYKEYELFRPFRVLLYLLLSVEGCDNLKLLTIAATTANPLPTIRQTAVLRS